MELADRTAIVTGAGSGVGRALAIEFARQGAAVVCCGRRQARLDETLAQIERAGGRGLAVTADVTDEAAVNKLVVQTLDRFGAIDVLYNNAGSFQAIGALWELPVADWWHDVTINLLGVMTCCHAVLPYMIERDEGVIINMNGGGSTVPLTGGGAYGCSKAAVLRLTDTLAAELRAVGSEVLVFALGPGLVRTEMTELQIQTEAGRRWIPSTKECLESGRHRPPEDCARSAVELIKIACPALSGRVFDTGADFTALAGQAERIQAEDLLTLRSRKL